jgi:hypothetical protein
MQWLRFLQRKSRWLFIITIYMIPFGVFNPDVTKVSSLWAPARKTPLDAEQGISVPGLG